MESISTYNNELMDKLIDGMVTNITDHAIDDNTYHANDEQIQLERELSNPGTQKTGISSAIVCDPILTNGTVSTVHTKSVQRCSTATTTSDENSDLNVGLETSMYSDVELQENDIFNGALAEIKKEFDVNDCIGCGEEIHRCSICGDEYNWKQSLQRHMLTHNIPKPHNVQCKLCNEKRSTKSGLKLKHTVAMYECSVCRTVCASSADLAAHHKLHSQSQENQFVCCVCQKSFSEKSSLTVHAASHSELEKSLRAAPGPTHGPTIGSGPRLDWTCGTCNISFRQKRQLVEHQRKHSGKRAFECGRCDQSFSQETHLIRHQKTHHRRSADEVYDDKYYKETNKHSYISYQAKHISKSVANVSKDSECSVEHTVNCQCLTCCKYFVDYVGHDCKAKYEDRPFKCDFCSKAFKLSSHLVRHKSTVHVVKQYDICLGHSQTHANYKLQSCGENLSHTREKPSLCTYCNKYFSRRHDLKRHQELKRCKMMTKSTPPNWAHQPIVREKAKSSTRAGNNKEDLAGITTEKADALDKGPLDGVSYVDDILTAMKINPDSLEVSGIGDPLGLVEALASSSSSSLMDDSSMDSMLEAEATDPLSEPTQRASGHVTKDIGSSICSESHRTHNDECLPLNMDEYITPRAMLENILNMDEDMTHCAALEETIHDCTSQAETLSMMQCSEYNGVIPCKNSSVSPISSINGTDSVIQFFPLSVTEEGLSIEVETTSIFANQGAELGETQLPFGLENGFRAVSVKTEMDGIDVMELHLPVTTC